MFNHPKVAADSEQSGGTGDVLCQLAADAAGEQMARFEVLDLLFPRPSSEESCENENQFSAVQWILKTDTDVITAAARMVPGVEWLEDSDVTEVLYRLRGQLYACFDSTRHTLSLAQARAAPLRLEFRFRMPIDHDFLVLYCATNRPLNLDITSLSSSDRMWLAHVYTSRLNNGEDQRYLVSFVIDIIRDCLGPQSPSRLFLTSRHSVSWSKN